MELNELRQVYIVNSGGDYDKFLMTVDEFRELVKKFEANDDVTIKVFGAEVDELEDVLESRVIRAISEEG